MTHVRLKAAGCVDSTRSEIFQGYSDLGWPTYFLFVEVCI